MSFSDEEKARLENNLKRFLSLLDDIRQVLVNSNEQTAKVLDNTNLLVRENYSISKEADSEVSLLDDIRQELVDNKEQTAKVADNLLKLIKINQDILYTLKILVENK